MVLMQGNSEDVKAGRMGVDLEDCGGNHEGAKLW